MEAALLGLCNWSTLGVCAALKLPQISAVLAARSARGLSLPSLLLELAGLPPSPSRCRLLGDGDARASQPGGRG
ncbi:hypothetical protein P7K49_028523 [Saguinus oedipus]|uniref:Uncharacterized protein n=1 Tax=Saguinus oedipus TaxID=9490 RepID=A0ABQ9U5D4_SAGOE|nr:hypothetical protein P7K49_028523 [Saguinus oedipus]